MLARNADTARAVSAGESGMLDQPGCRNFLALLQCWIARRGQSLGSGSFPQVFMLRFREHGILEKRARALAIGIAGNNQHALQGANVAYRLASLGEIGRDLAALEVPFQICIAYARLAAGRERVCHTQNDEAAALGRVKNAGAISAAAGAAEQLR